MLELRLELPGLYPAPHARLPTRALARREVFAKKDCDLAAAELSRA